MNLRLTKPLSCVLSPKGHVLRDAAAIVIWVNERNLKNPALLGVCLCVCLTGISTGNSLRPDLSGVSGCWICSKNHADFAWILSWPCTCCFWQPHTGHKKWQLSSSNWSSKCLEKTFQNVLRWASCQLTTSLDMWFPSFASHVFAWHHDESMCVCRHLARLNQRDFFLEVTDLEEWCKFQAKFEIQNS